MEHHKILSFHWYISNSGILSLLLFFGKITTSLVLFYMTAPKFQIYEILPPLFLL